jgi:hypothetical protein
MRVYTRKFDWDEARRLREAGTPYATISTRLGVSYGAVYFALNDGARELMAARNKQWQREGVCEDCGARCSRNASRAVTRCSACAGKIRATSVRGNELLCLTCRKWQPHEAFPMGGNRARSGRHQQCRTCNTDAKREWRKRVRVPCSHGCGTMVEAKNRRYPNKPHECRPCAMRRIGAERRAA